MHRKTDKVADKPMLFKIQLYPQVNSPVRFRFLYLYGVVVVGKIINILYKFYIQYLKYEISYEI